MPDFSVLFQGKNRWGCSAEITQEVIPRAHHDDEPNTILLEWTGEDWDGQPDQFLINRGDSEDFSVDQFIKVTKATSDAAAQSGYVLTLNPERCCGHSFIFFDLDGDVLGFDPQAFINDVVRILNAGVSKT